MMCNTSYFFALLIVLGVIVGSSGMLQTRCAAESLDNTESCDDTEVCMIEKDQTFGICQCPRRFIETDGKCVRISTTAAASIDPDSQRTTEKSSGSSVAVGLLVPTILIVLGGLGICFARRYHLFSCYRNRYGNVLVTRDEDDDDDPPIA